MYKGCEVEHYRKKFEGEEYIQLFLHYVDMDGPMKEYGLVTQIPDILNFNFVHLYHLIYLILFHYLFFHQFLHMI